MRGKKEGGRADIHARITERIVADLEKGVRPWVQPWSAGNATGRITRPLRHNGEPYTGMNVLLLWSEGLARGFSSPTWMTFKQSIELGGHVRKGESGSTVIYASRLTKTETDEQGGEVERDIPFLKAYNVFNAEQIQSLPEHFYRRPAPILDPVERIEHADRFFANTGSVIRHGGSRAFYSPASDHIQMPRFEIFRDAASYVAVLSHEHVHWTADARRVGRDLSRYAKDRSERAREELVAEIGIRAGLRRSRHRPRARTETGSCSLSGKLDFCSFQQQARNLLRSRSCAEGGCLSPQLAAAEQYRAKSRLMLLAPLLEGEGGPSSPIYNVLSRPMRSTRRSARPITNAAGPALRRSRWGDTPDFDTPDRWPCRGPDDR
ncbi:antirestriction protein ArdC [Bradyrhizobium diazoefficiens]